MTEGNFVPVFDCDELETTRDWFEHKGKHVFRTFCGMSWFFRTHRNELLRSGKYFPGRGSAPTRVTGDFGLIVVKIMQRIATTEVKDNSDPATN